MEIILKEDIIGLGYKNDIVNVKSGYGRNYLIPTGKGVIASDSAKKVLAENMKQQAAKLAAQKVAVTGHLYGSVGPAKVAEELAKLGIEIDRKIITMKEARKVGDFEATVHFHREVEVKVPVKVVAEHEVAAPAEEAAPAEAAPAEEAPKAEEATPAEQAAPAEAKEEEAPAAE